MSTPELERFASQVLAIRAKRRAPCLPQSESDLLAKINEALAPELQQRFDELTDKRLNEKLTAAEHEELLALVD